MNTFFVIRPYDQTIDLALTNEKDGPRFFQIYGNHKNLTEFMDFTAALMMCHQRGDILISYDSLRWGVRYLTENIPVKLDGVSLALGHIDLRFWMQSQLPYALNPIPCVIENINQAKNLYGTLNILQWLARLMMGQEQLGYLTWLAGEQSVGAEFHQQVVDVTKAQTVGEILVDFVKETGENNDQDFSHSKIQLTYIYAYIAWLFSYKDELEHWIKEKPRHESRESFNHD